jgi:hypothetical protein
MPGTFLEADRHWCGREGTPRLCPISDTCQNILVTDPEHAREIWSQHLYGVLLVCGHGVDVLELTHRMIGTTERVHRRGAGGAGRGHGVAAAVSGVHGHRLGVLAAAARGCTCTGRAPGLRYSPPRRTSARAAVVDQLVEDQPLLPTQDPHHVAAV